MKLRLYFRPSIAVLLLAAPAALGWWAVAIVGPGLALLAAALALFYSALFALAAWARWRIHVIERPLDWNAPGRLLVLAPHEDDCAISAGGLGARNRRLGGVTRIVYLAPDETPEMAEIRSAEARAAWLQAGVAASDLSHLDLLPPLGRRDPVRLRAAAAALRRIIDEFEPTAVVMPMFEGGHIHHDMTAALIGVIVTPQDTFTVFEAPEYSPYVSLNATPHKVIALCVRWLFGLVSYYGPPDGIDGRTIYTLRLEPSELDCKRRMLAAFTSQNAPSLVATRSYPDRLARWDATRRRARPFDPENAYLRLTRAARQALPGVIVDRILPGQRGTIGRGDSVTEWDEEWSLQDTSSGNSERGTSGC